MGRSRIFVGNLDVDVNEAQIVEKFSPYGNIVNIELKSKLDIEGNPLSQFAYLNLEAEPGKVKECIQVLNNIELNGSYLKVEIARESFLDRLKREREQANNPTYNATAVHENYDNSSNDYNTQRYKSRFDHNTDYEDHNNFDSSYNYNSSKFENYNSNNTAFSKNDEKTNNEIGRSKEPSEPKTYSTFKRYDPTVSDHQHSPSQKVQKEHIPIETKKFVHVSTDLNFKGDSSSFSLLAKFGCQNDFQNNNQSENDARASENIFARSRNNVEKKIFEENPKSRSLKEETNLKENYSPVKSFNPKPKSRNFFYTSSDTFQESVDWLLTPLTAENKEEFESVREDLMNLYNLRQSRSVREDRPYRKGQKAKKGFGIGRSKYRFK